MQRCSSCQTPLEGSQILYNDVAAVICQKCLNGAEIKASHVRSNTNAARAAYGNLAVGVLSLFFNPLFTMSLITFVNAAYIFRRIATENRRGEVIRGGAARQTVAVVGATLGGISFVIQLLQLLHLTHRLP
jgi:hypothetical protein